MHSTPQTPHSSPADDRYAMMVAAGIAAVRSNEMEQARRLLSKAAALRPTDPTPWLWLSATTQDPAEQREYLESALAADPNNGAARRGLVMLSRKLDNETVLPEGAAPPPQAEHTPQDAAPRETYLCPRCGGAQVFDIPTQSLRCSHCGARTPIVPRPAADRAEQVMDFVLPTERGHRWSENQPRLLCGHCGAESLLPRGQIAEACPYCGAHQWLETDETRAMLDPHVLIPFQVEENAARRAIQSWLDGGWSSPDDLPRLAQQAALRPAYYPFWTFDGTLEIRWSCEVNKGNSRMPRWETRTGLEFEHFDDVLIPGLRGFPRNLLRTIQPFDLKAALAFDPAYLAGMPAVAYDLSLADASLLARETVVQRVRRTLHARVNILEEKRNLRTGGVNWSGMTFKYLLLPIWVGRYRYGNKEYPVWVNGQTGKVGGRKPRDTVKISALVGAALGALALIALLILYLTR